MKRILLGLFLIFIVALSVSPFVFPFEVLKVLFPFVTILILGFVAIFMLVLGVYEIYKGITEIKRNE